MEGKVETQVGCEVMEVNSGSASGRCFVESRGTGALALSAVAQKARINSSKLGMIISPAL